LTLHTAIEQLPPGPGTYALLFFAASASDLQAGRLGQLSLSPGWYVYCGSALGTGGLKARLSRHLRPALQHWHIDYLKPCTTAGAIWYVLDSHRHEHDWARAFLSLPEARLPFPRFGASDCRCPAHLIYFQSPPEPSAFNERLSILMGMPPSGLKVISGSIPTW
jgi:Uri superfamily endonuclease